MNTLLTEALGAFFLVLVIALTGDPLSIGVALMVMVYVGGHVSGAHYNPAVTLGVYLRGAISGKSAVNYVIAQLIGGLLAVIIAGLLGSTFVPVLGDGVSMGTAFLAEAVFTFALVLVVLSVATTKATKGNSYFGLAIGFTVFAAAMSVGGISGGAFNPVVGLSPWFYGLLQGGAFSYVWLYITAPLVGGALAAGAFKLMNPSE